jgi:hypothetical protein
MPTVDPPAGPILPELSRRTVSAPPTHRTTGAPLIWAPCPIAALVRLPLLSDLGARPITVIILSKSLLFEPFCLPMRTYYTFGV